MATTSKLLRVQNPKPPNNGARLNCRETYGRHNCFEDGLDSKALLDFERAIRVLAIKEQLNVARRNPLAVGESGNFDRKPATGTRV